MPLPEFGYGWVLFLDVAGLIWNSFGVKPFLGLLAGGAFGVAKKDHGGSPPVVGYLRVSPLEVLYAIATWKTMGFAAILNRSLSSRQMKKQKVFSRISSQRSWFSFMQLPANCGNPLVRGNLDDADAAGSCSNE